MDARVADILRAKSKGEENYLLKDHLKETLKRAIKLKRFIDENKSIRWKFDNTFFEKLFIACFLHDLGKINWKFQLELFSKEEKEYDKEKKRYKDDNLNKLYEFFEGYEKIDIKDHEIISLIYSLIFLDNKDWDRKVRTAILLHHYNQYYTNREINIVRILEDYPDLEKYVEFLINKEKEIKELLKDLLSYLESEILSYLESEKIKDEFAVNVLNGLKSKLNFEKIKEFKGHIEQGFGLTTIMKLFEIPDKEDLNRAEDVYEFFVFLGCLRRCDYSASGNVEIEGKGVPSLEENVYKELMQKIKKWIRKEEIWQEKVLKEKDSSNLVLIAPTGSGKTEFALLWARNRGKKLVYTLPLRVALNDLHSRFGERYFSESALGILHSTSFIEYLKKTLHSEDTTIEDKVISSRLFSYPVLLTTPDQVLLSSLKYYGFDKVLSIYPLSAIVIDEIQAYKPEMIAVIIKTLEMIKELQGDILIITATFPPYLESYLHDFSRIDLQELIRDGKLEEKNVKNYAIKRHKIETIPKCIFDYEDSKVNEEALSEIISLNKDKNIMIVVNNVGKAIELTKELEKELEKHGIDGLYLLHSRIIEKEKSKRIKEIKERLNEGKKVILVATQIVEASVDVDFDILITEISPIDSQIQRWGRIWRNRDSDYDGGKPNIYIFTGIDKGTQAIYDKKAIEKTINVLEKKEKEGRTLGYEDERKLIDEVYDNELLKHYKEEIEKNLDWLKYYSAEKKSEAQRIFRAIAGIQVLIPALMEKSDDEIERAFGEVIKDKNNWNLPWESEGEDCIVKKVKEFVSQEEKDKVDKWRLLSILYSHSFNLPIFAFNYSILESETFKGFFVLRTKGLDPAIIEEIRKYGVNNLRGFDIDSGEIEESENII